MNCCSSGSSDTYNSYPLVGTRVVGNRRSVVGNVITSILASKIQDIIRILCQVVVVVVVVVVACLLDSTIGIEPSIRVSQRR